MASKGGSGLSTVKYGTTKENVVSLTVVTPAGEAVRTRQRVRKSSTGCELTQLYLGSEGTLGVITELTLKLHPILATRCGAFVAFPAIEDAARATVGLLREQLATLVRCECLNADGGFFLRRSNAQHLPFWTPGTMPDRMVWVLCIRSP
jgi:D-lactate dehydrogenase (cytochrome)